MSRVAIVLLICSSTLGMPRSIGATALLDQASLSGITEIAALPAIETQAKPAPPARPAVPTPAAQPTPPPPPAAPGAPATLALPPPPAAPAPAIPAIPRNNIQLEFTITDQTGNGAPDKKMVSMIAADGTWGRVRTSATTHPQNSGRPIPVSLNIDARPVMVGSDKVQTELTIEYKPVTPMLSGGVQEEPTQVNQSLTVTLVSGRSMVVSQAADPVIDRKVVVEAKATVLK